MLSVLTAERRYVAFAFRSACTIVGQEQRRYPLGGGFRVLGVSLNRASSLAPLWGPSLAKPVNSAYQPPILKTLPLAFTPVEFLPLLAKGKRAGPRSAPSQKMAFFRGNRSRKRDSRGLDTWVKRVSPGFPSANE